MINKIKETFSDIELKIILQVGSSLFSNKPRDLDFFCISSNLKKATRKKVDYEGYLLDIIVLNENEYADRMVLETRPPYHNLYNYQNLIAKIEYVQEGYVLPKFDMFNKEIKQKYLKMIAYNYLQTLGCSIQKHFYSKAFTHYYIIMKFYENNSSELTEEMLININKLREKEEGYGQIIDEVDEFLRTYEEEMLKHITGQ